MSSPRTSHDLGGRSGYGRVEGSESPAPFHHEWEARVFGINRLLLAAGCYNLDQFRDAVERLDPDVYARASYYERWLLAIESLVGAHGAQA